MTKQIDELMREVWQMRLAVNPEAQAKRVQAALEAALKPEEPAPPFGSKRSAAMEIYTPPFKFHRGYIFDSQNHMVADDREVDGAVAARVRGWGRIGYMPNGAEIQDEIGQMVADALNAYYTAPPAQTAPSATPLPYWYTLSSDGGMICQCRDKEYAIVEAKKADAEYPRGTPHMAGRLCIVEHGIKQL